MSSPLGPFTCNNSEVCGHHHDRDELKITTAVPNKNKTWNLMTLTPFNTHESPVKKACWAPHHFLFEAFKRTYVLFKSPIGFGNQTLKAFLHTTYSQDSQASSSCASLPKSSVTFSLASAWYQRQENLGDHLDLTFLQPFRFLTIANLTDQKSQQHN